MLLTSELVCISVHGFTLNLDGIIHGCRVVFSHSLLIVDWYVWNLNNQMVIPVLYDYVNLHWLYSCNSRMFEFIHRYRPEFSLGYRRLSWYCVCSTESFALQSPNPAWCPQHRSTIHRNYTSMKCNSWPLLSHALPLHNHQHRRKFSNITFAWYYSRLCNQEAEVFYFSAKKQKCIHHWKVSYLLQENSIHLWVSNLLSRIALKCLWNRFKVFMKSL